MEKRFIPNYILDYCIEHSSCFDDITENIYTSSIKHPDFHMLVGNVIGMLIHIIILNSKPKRVFELGSFTGYMSSIIDSALEDEAILISSEENKENYNISKVNLHVYIESGRIKIYHCNGMTLLEDESIGKFDMIFIDARKETYCSKLDAIYNRLNTDRFLIVDNSLAGLGVFNPQESWHLLTKQFNESLFNDHRFKVVQLPIRDGLTLAIRV